MESGIIDLKRGSMLNRVFGIPPDQISRENEEAVGWLSNDKRCFFLRHNLKIIDLFEESKEEEGKKTKTKKVLVGKELRFTPKSNLTYTKSPGGVEFRVMIQFPAALGGQLLLLEPHTGDTLEVITVSLSLDTDLEPFKSLPYMARIYLLG